MGDAADSIILQKQAFTRYSGEEISKGVPAIDGDPGCHQTDRAFRTDEEGASGWEDGGIRRMQGMPPT